MSFPVYWMVATGFKRGQDIFSDPPVWFPWHPTLSNFRDAIHRPFSGRREEQPDRDRVAVVLLSMVLAFLAALALAKFGFYGRQAFIVLIIGDPDDPAGGADHPDLTRALEGSTRWTRSRGVIVDLPDLRAAVHDLDAARVPARDPEGSRGGVDGRRHDSLRRVRAHASAARGTGPGGDLDLRFHPAWNEYIMAYVLLQDQRSRRSRSGSRTSRHEPRTPTGGR